MPPINVLIKPSSGNCNLKCQYCFYYDTMSKRERPSYGFMTEETLRQVIKKTLAYAEGTCTFVYQGGEPTLSGIPFFEKSVEFQKEYNVNHAKVLNAIQTNGYQLDEGWAGFFKEHDFLVGVSLDGAPKVHDLYRRTPLGGGSFSQVMKNIELLKRTGVEFNILSVITRTSAPLIARNYKFYRKNHLDYLQFIACLDPLDTKPGTKDYSLSPEIYGQFLISLFNLWYEDLCQGSQPFIRQFENYIAILLGQPPESCDMRGTCGMQYVIEADGSVYPCDFYVLDKYRLGNLLTDSMEELDRIREQSGFIETSKNKEEACRQCTYQPLCRGGCRRTRFAAQGYHQYFCRSYQMFFDACLPRMMDIAGNIRSGQGVIR